MIRIMLSEIRELNSLDNKTIPERIIKFNEEYGEFNAEVAKMVGITHKSFDKDHLKEEMADTLQNLFSIYIDICDKQDISMDEIFEEVFVKNQKWREKVPLYTKNLKKEDETL